MAQDVKNQKARRGFGASFKLQIVQMIKAQGLRVGGWCWLNTDAPGLRRECVDAQGSTRKHRDAALLPRRNGGLG